MLVKQRNLAVAIIVVVASDVAIAIAAILLVLSVERSPGATVFRGWAASNLDETPLALDDYRLPLVLERVLDGLLERHRLPLGPGSDAWYGMPAYARDGKVVCFLISTRKFNSRYATLGFGETSILDEGALGPISLALRGGPPSKRQRSPRS